MSSHSLLKLARASAKQAYDAIRAGDFERAAQLYQRAAEATEAAEAEAMAEYMDSVIAAGVQVRHG